MTNLHNKYKMSIDYYVKLDRTILEDMFCTS